MGFPTSRWALALAACWLAAGPAPTSAQGTGAVPAEPLPEDVQLLFDIELRGPPGGPTNLLPWTAANEAIVAEVLCRGYLPAADCSTASIEVVNTFTFLAPAPADAGTGGSSSRRMLQGMALPRQQQAQQAQQRLAPQPQQQQRQAAAAPAPAQIPEQGQEVAPAPAPVPALKPPPQQAAPAPAPAVALPRWQREAAAQQELAAAPAPATAQPQRRREVAAAEAPAPAAEQPGRQADHAPPPTAQQGQREDKAGRQRQERQQQQEGQDSAPPPEKDRAGSSVKKEAPLEEMVSGTGVELKITLPSTLARAAAELDAVEGAVTVGRLAQDLTAAGLVVESATLVAAYVEEPAAEGGRVAAAAWAGGAPAVAPDF